jgi:subfamily B ATP-binding cassette protein MsbA
MTVAKDMGRVAVLMGGASAERDISLLSGHGVLEALRVELYRKLQHLPLSYFGRNRSGDLLSRLTSDTQVVQQTITSSASDLVIQPITLLGAVYFLGITAL